MTRREIMVIALVVVLGTFALWWQRQVALQAEVVEQGSGTLYVTPIPPSRPATPQPGPVLQRTPSPEAPATPVAAQTPPTPATPVPMPPATPAPATPPPIDPRWKRAQQLRAGTEALTNSQVEEACSFLVNVVEVTGLSETEAEDLCNGLMYRLERDATPERFAELLVKLMGAEGQRPSLRDDAVHHLALWCTRETPTEAVRGAFWGRSEETSGQGGPTALLALRRMELNAQLPPEETARLLSVCGQLARSPEGTDSVKLTALEILLTARDRAALPVAREVIAREHSIALTIVALGAIGAMGDREDIGRLSNQPHLERKGLEEPLKQALKRLAAKPQSPPDGN
jgi:hypothetical protein